VPVASGDGGNRRQRQSRRCAATWSQRRAGASSGKAQLSLFASRPIRLCVRAKRISKASRSISGVKIACTLLTPPLKALNALSAHLNLRTWRYSNFAPLVTPLRT
jgi:hypothetical protein